MPLLPPSRVRVSRRLAYGGALPEDPLLTERKRRQQQRDGLNDGLSQAAGTGLDAVAPGAGQLLQLSNAASKGINSALQDEDGLYKNDSFGTRLAAGVANNLNPVATISSLASHASAVGKGERKWTDLYGIQVDQELRKKLQLNKQQQQLDTSTKMGQQVYAGLPGGSFRRGGLLPRNVIASGALHSEKNQHHGHPTAGKRGVPVLAANGAKLAEVERDELTLHDAATAKVEQLRQGGGLLALGRFMQKELLTNTTPSTRYAKRLAA